MSLIISIVVIILLSISMVIDVKRIKSNKEIIKKDNEILTAQKELKDKLDLKNKIAKETQDDITKMKEYHKELKDNLALDYDHLTEEVIKRINEKQKLNTNTFINV